MSNVSKVRRPKVVIQMDLRGEEDKELNLKFTLNSYALMEEKYGSVDAAMDAIKGKSMIAVQFMLWAGLKSAIEDLTPEEVGEAMDMRDMDYYMDKVALAMETDNPEGATKSDNPNS